MPRKIEAFRLHIAFIDRSRDQSVYLLLLQSFDGRLQGTHCILAHFLVFFTKIDVHLFFPNIQHIDLLGRNLIQAIDSVQIEVQIVEDGRARVARMESGRGEEEEGVLNLEHLSQARGAPLLPTVQCPLQGGR